MDILSNIVPTQPTQPTVQRNARKRAQHVAHVAPVAPVQVAPVKRGRGQPTLYRPDYCEQIEQHMAKGYSASSFGGVVGVCMDTISEWKRVHPDFSAAIKRGQAARIFVWESRLMLCDGKTAAPVLFALKNIHPDEWREIHRTELTGANGGAIKIEEASDDELMRIAGLSKRN